MFCTRISARLYMSDRGLSHIFESSGASVRGLTSIKNALVKCLFIFNWS